MRLQPDGPGRFPELKTQSDMKFSEMNDNQKQVYTLVVNNANELIGGLENTMEDNPKDSDEYREAKAKLANHEELVEDVYIWVRSTTIWQRVENLHFVSLEWLHERCEKRITKMGY